MGLTCSYVIPKDPAITEAVSRWLPNGFASGYVVDKVALG
jgi:hypothetical protein